MAVPLAFWVAASCAVVLFLRYPDRREDTGQPIALMATFSQQDDGWVPHRHSLGLLWLDPIEEPGVSGLDGRAITESGGCFTDQPFPGHPAAVVVGLVSPAVAAIALVQEGHEDQRDLQSHFGAWVVCTEKWVPYRIDALDGTGAVIGSTGGPPKLPARPSGPDAEPGPP
jgi:hypothetical protein